ncbi:uncharacterized protein BHQ10_003254 [Talaromyces amestolkiae]|uniref:MARVEL domain-containing protein n=1 Tax=Talaromyces amestolkiae TaxID=1196081 RepID=A0A364KUL3_TALAM|nr:uncharacterized protein BHQ10_003254 [Talaromyces amestolkiae]RAO67242.1 hypothetical protein BHQ10_003254 [Talaromyces amestolkiae]
MDETTPLLPERNDDDHHDENPITTRRTSSSSRILIILNWTSIIISALNFVYSLTVFLVVRLSSYYGYLNWTARETFQVSLLLAFLSSIVSLFGIYKLTFQNRSGWLLINLIFDPLIVFLFMFSPAITRWEISSWVYCSAPGRGFPDPGFEARCDKFASYISAAILVAFIFHLIILSIHLVFFICDVVLGVQRLRQNGLGWRFPTGQFTVEFTVKVLKQRDDSHGLVES